MREFGTLQIQGNEFQYELVNIAFFIGQFIGQLCTTSRGTGQQGSLPPSTRKMHGSLISLIQRIVRKNRQMVPICFGIIISI